MHNRVTFAQYEAVLKEFGFQMTVVPDSHVLYRHARSDTILMVRIPEPDEEVPWHVAAAARRHLESRGVVSPDDFEEMLRQVAA